MADIPFGFHKPLNKFVDAGSIPKGRACNCVCDVCGTALEAVHPIIRKKHFRHASLKECKGVLESLFHKVAKQILKESSAISLPNTEKFIYDQCETEFERHGKRPDAYLVKGEDSLLVEIYFTHHPDTPTLEVYHEKGERVLEIDISSEKMQIFKYERLKDLVLYSGLRSFIGDNKEKNDGPKRHVGSSDRDDSNWWFWIIVFILTIGIGYFIYKRFRKGRRRKRF